MSIEIRHATATDADAIWRIFHRVIASGDTYVFPPDAGRDVFDKHWMAYDPLVALENGAIVGTYIIKANQMGLGDHVANGSYMVHPDHFGKGIGYKLGEHSLAFAREQGFQSIQFNIVIATNEPALRLWKKLGFRIIGTSPKAFRHAELGLVDAHILWREL